MSEPTTFAELLTQAADAAGLDVAALSKKLAVPPEWVIAYQHGYKLPYWSTLKNMCAVIPGFNHEKATRFIIEERKAEHRGRPKGSTNNFGFRREKNEPALSQA